jgi:tetratricopeptide (TPR) repeat protein
VKTPRDRAPSRVIHVDFARRRKGPGATERAPEERPPEGARGNSETDRSPDLEGTAVARTFTAAEVADVFGLSLKALTRWHRHGIVRPSGRHGRAAVYTFQDLVAVRTAKGLADAGFPVAQLKRALERLREGTPQDAQPLAEARVRADGRQLQARADALGGASFDPTTGQLLLDFDHRALREDVVRRLRPRLAPRLAEAYEHYLEGLRLDEDETTQGRAEGAYRRALELDPRLANALVNLGNLRLARGDLDEAEGLYRRALVADPRLAEAPYNLGYLLAERGRHREAAEAFTHALRLQPEFPEAHFNLGNVCAELGELARAAEHYRAYLTLEPDGRWSALARQYLGG